LIVDEVIDKNKLAIYGSRRLLFFFKFIIFTCTPKQSKVT